MFKFVHCADLHLDSPLRGLAGKLEGSVEEVRAATRQALKNLVDLCIAERVEFLLIAGDVYDGDWPDYQTGLYFAKRMAELGRYGIRVFLIRGNHDAASHITKQLVLPENVRELSVDYPETVVLEHLGVAIHGQGFREREVRENLVPHYPDPIPGCFNIGMLHTCAEGAEGHERYAPCRLDDLIRKGYDYWALGHIHKRQILHEQPYIVFPGNIQGRHIRESGDKGCMLVTVDRGRVQLEYRPLDVMRWYVCAVDLTGATTVEELHARVVAAIQKLTDENPGHPLALRMELEGETSLHGTLVAQSDHVRNEVANAIEQLDKPVWLEKVLVRTAPPIRAGESVRHGDAWAVLLESMEAAADDTEFLGAWLADCAAWQSRLSAYLRREDATRILSAKDAAPILQDARELLWQLLMQGGGTR